MEDEPSLEEEDMVELEEAVVEPQKVMDRGDMTFNKAAPDELEEDLTSDPFDDSLSDPDYQEEVRGQVSSSSESNQELEESFPTGGWGVWTSWTPPWPTTVSHGGRRNGGGPSSAGPSVFRQSIPGG